MCVLVAKPQQSMPGVNALEKAAAMKRSLLDDIERFGDRLPPNTLDQLINELGGPDCVAEVWQDHFGSIVPALLQLCTTFFRLHRHAKHKMWPIVTSVL